MSTDHDLDFSTSTIPESWQAAAGQSPTGADAGQAGSRNDRRGGFRVPNRTSLDTFSAIMAGTIGSGLLGLGWYQLESSGTLIAPWLAIIVGVVLAMLVRAGGGPDDPGTRGILALGFYVITSATVVVLVARKVFATAYGANPGVAEFEQALVHSRFGELLFVGCWLVGAVAAVQISRILRRRA